MIGIKVRDFVPAADLLRYVEAIMRVYNAEGRRDNKYKARIKILVHEKGGEEFRAAVEQEFSRIPPDGEAPVEKELRRIAAFFTPPSYEALAEAGEALAQATRSSRDFARWVRTNTRKHKAPGYAIAIVSLKPGRRRAGRCRGRADARSRRRRRQIQPRRAARFGRAEHRPAIRQEGRAFRPVAGSRRGRVLAGRMPR